MATLEGIVRTRLGREMSGAMIAIEISDDRVEVVWSTSCLAKLYGNEYYPL